MLHFLDFESYGPLCELLSPVSIQVSPCFLCEHINFFQGVLVIFITIVCPCLLYQDINLFQGILVIFIIIVSPCLLCQQINFFKGILVSFIIIHFSWLHPTLFIFNFIGRIFSFCNGCSTTIIKEQEEIEAKPCKTTWHLE